MSKSIVSISFTGHVVQYLLTLIIITATESANYRPWRWACGKLCCDHSCLGRLRRRASRSGKISSVSAYGSSLNTRPNRRIYRYHVGESMVPSCRQFLKLIDLEGTIENFGFCKKVDTHLTARRRI